jgi:hypothetical protein
MSCQPWSAPPKADYPWIIEKLIRESRFRSKAAKVVLSPTALARRTTSSSGPGSGDDLKIDGRQAQIGEQELDTRGIDRIDRATPPSSDRSSVHVPRGF